MNTHANVTRRALVATFATGALYLAGCATSHEGQTTTSADATAKDSQATAQSLPWWKKTIVYEAYPKSFQSSRGAETVDVVGVTSRLDYLKELGVGAIWITPCYKSPMVDNGYDIEDYHQIDPSFGTMDDMDELIARGREKGIRVVLDLAFNHTSDQCDWFLESRKSRDGAYAD